MQQSITAPCPLHSLPLSLSVCACVRACVRMRVARVFLYPSTSLPRCAPSLPVSLPCSLCLSLPFCPSPGTRVRTTQTRKLRQGNLGGAQARDEAPLPPISLAHNTPRITFIPPPLRRPTGHILHILM